ncbi:MAG: NAD-dependent epimerase/dehydratase family protein [Longimicrobiales bacterium]|nr:NAD-dependent epimerase/dehydratase family protein [Longimicrobiales bacterium]
MTGATGYIGSAIVRELVARDHRVTGLTRLAEKASYLRELGVSPVIGDLRDADSYRDAVMTSDALVHVAAEHSDSRVAVDRAAVEALLEGAADGPARVVVYTSGCFVLGETGSEPAHEDAGTEAAPELVAWRPAHEERVLDAGSDELAASVIRPGMVYGGKDGAFARFFATAEEDGAVEFVGDGANRWSPVYRGDVARLYRMVVEDGGRGIYHCAEPAERVGELAMAASRAAGAGGATKRLRVEEAREELGAFADALTMDQVVGCRRAHDFGWEPDHEPFIESAEAVYREWKG